MRSALGIIGMVVCILGLPALAVLAVFAQYDAEPKVMGTIAVTAITVCAFIIAGEEERYVRVIGWIMIAIAASPLYAALDSVTDSRDRLPAPAVSILLPLGAAMLCGWLRQLRTVGSAAVVLFFGSFLVVLLW
jgi:hypothetical protein